MPARRPEAIILKAALMAFHQAHMDPNRRPAVRIPCHASRTRLNNMLGLELEISRQQILLPILQPSLVSTCISACHTPINLNDPASTCLRLPLDCINSCIPKSLDY